MRSSFHLVETWREITADVYIHQNLLAGVVVGAAAGIRTRVVGLEGQWTLDAMS